MLYLKLKQQQQTKNKPTKQPKQPAVNYGRKPKIPVWKQIWEIFFPLILILDLFCFTWRAQFQLPIKAQ